MARGLSTRLTKDDLRRETETHAGYKFSELEWSTVRELSRLGIVRIGMMLNKAYSEGFKTGRKAEADLGQE